MISFTNLTGLAGSVLCIAAFAVLLLGTLHLSKPWLLGLVLAVAIAVCIPFGGLPLAAYLRAVVGDLSITAMVLLTLFLLKYFCSCEPFGHQDKVRLQGLIVLGALALYPLALGIGYFDPYRLGFGNLWLVAMLLVITLIACAQRHFLVALCISLAVLGWSIGWYESSNLWNYLLDPVVAIYAIGALIGQAVQLWKKGKSTFTAPRLASTHKPSS